MFLTRPPRDAPKDAPFDLHALGTPPALILSQDQTLHQDGSPRSRVAPFPSAKCICVAGRSRSVTTRFVLTHSRADRSSAPPRSPRRSRAQVPAREPRSPRIGSLLPLQRAASRPAFILPLPGSRPLPSGAGRQGGRTPVVRHAHLSRCACGSRFPVFPGLLAAAR